MVGVATALGAYVALSAQEPAPALSAGERIVARRGLNELKREAEGIHRDAAQRMRRAFSLDVSEGELNLLLSEDASVRDRLERRGIRDASVRIRDGEIQASLTRAVVGVPMHAHAVLKPELSGPRSVTARIVSLTIGRVPTPAAPAQRMADEVGDLLSKKVTDTNVVLTGLSVLDGRVVLEGRIE